jgi:hypothetical protein
MHIHREGSKWGLHYSYNKEYHQRRYICTHMCIYEYRYRFIFMYIYICIYIGKGRSGGFITATIKNIINGNQFEKKFLSDDMVKHCVNTYMYIHMYIYICIYVRLIRKIECVLYIIYTNFAVVILYVS